MYTVDACAKINLYLDITGRRADGYHTLETVMQSVSLCDTVQVGVCAGNGIVLHCDDPLIPSDERNIAYKAAERYLAAAGTSAQIMIDIQKHIPSGAGMGGGSADAAAVLFALDRHYGRVPQDKLYDIALSLGADVPFCLAGGTKVCKGIGEEMSEAPEMSGYSVLIVMPDFTCPTGEAYSRYDRNPVPAKNGLGEFCTALGKGCFADKMYNVFEVLYEDKRIDNIKNELISAGALGAMLTGSGAAVFGIFETESAAAEAAKRFTAYFTSVCRPTVNNLIIS